MTAQCFYAPDGHFYVDPFTFCTSIHKDVSERLPYLKPQLAEQVREILLFNKQERHIRGGMATKEKYARLAALKGYTELQKNSGE